VTTKRFHSEVKYPIMVDSDDDSSLSSETSVGNTDESADISHLAVEVSMVMLKVPWSS
jgi:hypothetical protein